MSTAASSSGHQEPLADPILHRYTSQINDAARRFLSYLQVFIISVREVKETGSLYTSQFVNQLKMLKVNVRVLQNPCVPVVKTERETGRNYVADATLRGLMRDENAWRQLSESPQSLGCLASHLNCWWESLHTCEHGWCLVMEEDVQETENAMTFLLDLVELLVHDDVHVNDLQMIHLLHDNTNHNFTKKVMESASIATNKNMHLMWTPKFKDRFRSENVGAGFRSYMMCPKLMKRLTAVEHKWHTWCDMQVALADYHKL